MHCRRTLLAVVSAVILAGFAEAAGVSDLPFPLRPTARVDALDGMALEIDHELATALSSNEHVHLTGAVLGEGRVVDLELERVRASTNDIRVTLDGAPSTWSPPRDATCWTGSVAGEPGSEVFLGVSRFGTRGWIRTLGETWHVLAAPGPEGDWSHATARIVSERELHRSGASLDFACRVAPAPVSATQIPLTPRGGSGSSALTVLDTLECRLAIETDYQLFQKFANVTAEQNYLNQLFAAANARFTADVSTVLSIAYLGLHTNPNDGWTSGDVGAGMNAMLEEFRLAWLNQIPNGAHLAHFLSGAVLGGGGTYTNVLCHPTHSFAISGDLVGVTPFPVAQGPLTWDFYVFAHETGHALGTLHTHELCPPIDQCAPSQSFGPCQTSQVCISNGTIMSYCHTCAGGMSNIALQFHPANIAAMRAGAESSCIPTLCTAPMNYCALSPNSYDPFGAEITYAGTNRISQNDLTLITTSVPPNTSGLYFYGRNSNFVPFGNGVRCIANPVFRLPVVQSNLFAEAVFQIDHATLPSAGRIHAGETWNFQLWFRNPAGGGAGFNTSDALRVQFCP